MSRRNRVAALSLVALSAFLPSCARNDAADLDKATSGMIVGSIPANPNLFDVVFPGDMRPDTNVIGDQGKSAQLVTAIRIAEGKPILMIKLVHFSVDEPLGVHRMTAAVGVEREASHYFSKKDVTRQSVEAGVLEFATMVPSHDESAKKVLDIILGTPPCSIEVGGAAMKKTTFTPSQASIEHAQKMADLYATLTERPSLIPLLQQKSLSVHEFQEAILK